MRIASSLRVKGRPAFAFARDVSFLSGGTAAARALGLLAAPLLTRIYEPSDFALLALVTSLSATLFAASSLSYDQAIAVTRREGEAANLLVVSLALVLVFGVALLAAALAFRDGIATLLNNADLAAWIWTVPAFVAARGWMQAAAFLCIRNGWFAVVGFAALVEGMVTVAGKLGLAYVRGPDAGALLAGATLGLAAGVVTFAAVPRMRPSSAGKLRISRARIAAAVKRYREFPLFNSWTTLLNAVSENVNVLLFSAFFTPAVVGAYSFARRTVAMPVTYLGTNVYKVFLGHAARRHREGARIDRSMLRATGALLLIGVLPFGALAFFGREIFTVVFGPAWGDAGRYAEIIAPALLVSFVNGPATSLYSVLRRVGVRLAYTLVHTAVRLAAVVWAYVTFRDIEACLIAYTWVVVSFNVFYIGLAHVLARPGRAPSPAAQAGRMRRA